MTEMEHLIDARDMQYHRDAGMLQEAAVNVLKCVNHTAVTELRYDALYEKVVAALEKPCHPQGMYSYSVHVGRSTGTLLAELDNRLRSYRRKVSRHSASLAQHAGVETALALDLLDREGEVLTGLQRGVAIVQARQADASLRVTRAQLLTAANALEDLLAPLLSATPVIGRGLQVGSRVAKPLAPTPGTAKASTKAEKVVVIQHLLSHLYALAANVQHHLDALADVEASLSARSSGSVSPSTGQDAEWLSLGGWVAKASALSIESVRALQRTAGPKEASATSTGHADAKIERSEASSAKISAPAGAMPRTAPSTLQLAAAPVTLVRLAAPTIKTHVADFTQILLDRLTATVFGHHAHSSDLVTNAVIAQLALLVVHRLSTATAGVIVADAAKDTLLAEFVLPADVRTVIEGCVVDSQPLLSSLQEEGLQVTHTADWTAVHRNNLTFARELAHMCGGGLFSASLQNNLWVRELRYRNNKPHNVREVVGSEYHLLQVLNPSGRSADAVNRSNTAQGEAVVDTSVVLLALYIDLSPHSKYFEGSNCTLRWEFRPTAIEERHRVVLPDDATSSTTVKVTLALYSPPGVMHMLWRHYAEKQVRMLVQHWQRNAADILLLHRDSPEATPARTVNEELLLESLRDRTARSNTASSVHASERQTVVWGGPQARSEEEGADLLRLQDADGTVSYYPFTTGAHADPTTDSTVQPGSPNTTHRASAGLRDVADRVRQRSDAVQQTFLRQRKYWRKSGETLQDLKRAPAAFADQLIAAGLQRRSRAGVLGLLRPRLLVR
jgi:predicted aconitase with swiveling domain